MSRFLISSLRRAESIPVPAALAGAAAGAPCPGLRAPDMVAKLSRKQRHWTARDSRSCRYSLVFLSMSSTHRRNHPIDLLPSRGHDTSRRARLRTPTPLRWSEAGPRKKTSSPPAHGVEETSWGGCASWVTQYPAVCCAMRNGDWHRGGQSPPRQLFFSLRRHFWLCSRS